jgi:acyl-CoA reductase-like NAD-dependent aldehyde dehydrogenase
MDELEAILSNAVAGRDLPYAVAAVARHDGVMVNGIKAGSVWVNCYGLLDTAVGMACYKLSGYGIKGGPDYVDAFLYEKCAYINMA